MQFKTCLYQNFTVFDRKVNLVGLTLFMQYQDLRTWGPGIHILNNSVTWFLNTLNLEDHWMNKSGQTRSTQISICNFIFKRRLCFDFSLAKEKKAKEIKLSVPVKLSGSHSLSFSFPVEHLLSVRDYSGTHFFSSPLCSWEYEENGSWGRKKTHILETLVMKGVHSPLPLSKGGASRSGWEHRCSSQLAGPVMNGMEQRPHRDPSISASDLYLWACMETPGSGNIMGAGCLNASATLVMCGALLRKQSCSSPHRRLASLFWLV